jgi:hypothetical protein
MSFRIHVRLPHTPIPMPDDPALLDQWLEANNKYVLFSEPLGADGTVYRYWSLIASQLGLPLLSSVYQRGLFLKSAEELARLERELDQLEGYWTTQVLEEVDPKSGLRGQLKEHLQERMGNMRTAITVARQHTAELSVS